jgi:hypothetical protein
MDAGGPKSAGRRRVAGAGPFGLLSPPNAFPTHRCANGGAPAGEFGGLVRRKSIITNARLSCCWHTQRDRFNRLKGRRGGGGQYRLRYLFADTVGHARSAKAAPGDACDHWTRLVGWEGFVSLVRVPIVTTSSATACGCAARLQTNHRRNGDGVAGAAGRRESGGTHRAFASPCTRFPPPSPPPTHPPPTPLRRSTRSAWAVATTSILARHGAAAGQGRSHSESVAPLLAAGLRHRLRHGVAHRETWRERPG